jgi:hypothetical protein
MPIINGVCTPAVCFSIKFDTSAAKMIVVTQQPDGSYAVDSLRTAALNTLPPDIKTDLDKKFNALKGKLHPLATLRCDGCRCEALGPFKGLPFNVPDQEIDTVELSDLQGTKVKGKVLLSGVTARIRFGLRLGPDSSFFLVSADGTARKLAPQDTYPDIEGRRTSGDR